MKRALATIGLALLPVAAGASCFEPTEPYCIRAYGTFEDEFSFESCRSELANYQNEVEAFVDCQRRENDQAISDFNEAVRYWNCKAQGGTIC